MKLGNEWRLDEEEKYGKESKSKEKYNKFHETESILYWKARFRCKWTTLMKCHIFLTWQMADGKIRSYKKKFNFKMLTIVMRKILFF